MLGEGSFPHLMIPMKTILYFLLIIPYMIGLTLLLNIISNSETWGKYFQIIESENAPKTCSVPGMWENQQMTKTDTIAIDIFNKFCSSIFNVGEFNPLITFLFTPLIWLKINLHFAILLLCRKYSWFGEGFIKILVIAHLLALRE